MSYEVRRRTGTCNTKIFNYKLMKLMMVHVTSITYAYKLSKHFCKKQNSDKWLVANVSYLTALQMYNQQCQ